MFSLRIAIKEFFAAKLINFQAIQNALIQPNFFIYFDPIKMIYNDVDIFKKCGFGTVAYHIKDRNSKATLHSIIPIIILSKYFTLAQSHYWLTELEVTRLVWVIRQLYHII